MKSFNPHLYVSMVHSDLSNEEIKVLKRIVKRKTGICMKSIYSKLGVYTIAEVRIIAVAAKIV